MISLVETRWILVKSESRLTISAIGTLLLVDLVLSAVIFIVLPGIVDQDFAILLRGIGFSGPKPWIGILFWSTFATSLLFYLFVAAVLAIKPIMSIIVGVDVLDNWFPIYDHPVRLVAIVMVCLATMLLIGSILLGT